MYCQGELILSGVEQQEDPEYKELLRVKNIDNRLKCSFRLNKYFILDSLFCCLFSLIMSESALIAERIKLHVRNFQSIIDVLYPK